MADATSDDLAARFDQRVISDLASDAGEPVVDITTDTNVSTALDDATGAFRAAVQVGGMYSDSDIDDLTGSSLALRKRIVCELAMIYLISRRPEKFGNAETYEAMRKGTEEYLDRLRKGERVFPAVTAAVEAGQASVDGPTAVVYERLNLLPDRTRNFYPSRGTRLPTNRQY
jgi:phage gp36-like protein